MARSIKSLVPEVEDLLALEPEEVAGVVLVHLRFLEEAGRGSLNRYNFSLNYTYNDYPAQYHTKIAEVLMEGWMWLEREGFLAPKPGADGSWFFITRRGMKVNSICDVAIYRKSNLLPKNQLHPLISQKVWATFLRGDYDTAVFQTFKEVEVSVRKAGGFTADDIGVPLMRKAFAPVDGPLTDKTLPKAEQEALTHLFAGAIGSYKNPHSHRAVSIDAEEAVEMIMLGSHLLKIVDARTKNNS
ncbi:MAG TPA: TIGR02391 family protein [Nitrosospira sp.]|nr:TIGR02391 family protein [Nitrosospira sp.]